MPKKILTSLLLMGLFIPFFPSAAQEIDPTFNPNRIIEDAEMMDVKSLSVSQIQQLLANKNSYLASYTTINAYGTVKSAAEIIYDAANNNYDCSGVDLGDNPSEEMRRIKCRSITTISPKVIITLLQKESSLIENPSPAQARLDWATGYGCPDSAACNPYYKGLGKQINSAALQFLAYMNEQQRYPYKMGQTYTFTNPYGTISKEPMVVTPENKATAALYNYTPHVFNGNYNFYILYNKYFPDVIQNYPDGSLLQVAGEPGVWLIQNGQKRPFTSYSALISRFDPNKIINIEATVLDAYSKGEPIKFPNYSLIETPDKKVYLIVDTEKRLIASQDVFKQIGFNKEEIIKATSEELAAYSEGRVITATSTYPTGRLVQDPKSGGVYYVESGYKYPIIDKIFLSTKFKGKKVNKGTTAELEKYTKGSPVIFGDGELLMSESSPTVYLISQGRKRPFTSGEIFESLGYKFTNVIKVSPQLLAMYPTGDPVIIQTTN